jgi:chemotaxis response regulator CheB
MSRPEDAARQVIAVGASAGGVEALTAADEATGAADTIRKILPDLVPGTPPTRGRTTGN